MEDDKNPKLPPNMTFAP